MVLDKNVPDKYTEMFDECAVEFLAKFARKHALDNGQQRTLWTDLNLEDPSKLPEIVKKWLPASEHGEVAEVMYEAMCECVRFGVDRQKRHTEEHFRQMFMTCKGI